MFEVIYKNPATIERYRLAPLLEDRERYLCAVVASGVVGDVARRVARTQLALMDLLSLPDADVPVSFATVEAAVQERCRNVPAVSAADFRRHAFRWLRFLGWLEEPVQDAHPHTRQVEAFAAWMRDDRGLSEATVGNCCYESDRLFAWAAGRNLMLADMTIGDVDEFLAARIAKGGSSPNVRARCGRVSAELFPFCRNVALVPAGHRGMHHAAAGLSRQTGSQGVRSRRSREAACHDGRSDPGRLPRSRGADDPCNLRAQGR